MPPVDTRPWFREPMLWLVIALPLAAVVAGISTVVIAVRAGGADSVSDAVRRTAQVQVADLAADRRAADLGLSATLDIDRETGALRVALAGDDAVRPERLRLAVTHPTAAADDVVLPLLRQGDIWLGRFGGDLGHDWKLVLAPEDGRWRLVARLPAGTSAARLLPALAD